MFKWFRDDFGDSRRARTAGWPDFAEPDLAQLRGWEGQVRYDYDWDLGAP